MKPEEFSRSLLDWYDDHGRKDLPWQKNRNPYRVWLSEIMLQQTQVATVIPYFERFVERFPDIHALADAHLDEVLGLWSGLGYYSRARNLHSAARMVRDELGSAFPQSLETLMDLPGIGRSTAGAILAQALGQRHPILDGNVKRVLTRFDAIEGWPGRAPLEKRLWDRSEELTPTQRLADYTQAIMDLGATVCRRSRPGCNICPVQRGCQAFARGEQAIYPTPKPRKHLTVRQVIFILATDNDDRVLLEQRPPSGVWGGLWSLPQLPEPLNESFSDWCLRQFGALPGRVEDWPAVRHTFSHFHLHITPRRVRLKAGAGPTIMEAANTVWYKSDLSNQLGIPAPVKRLLERLEQEREQML